MNREREHLLGDILAEPGGSGELRELLLDRTLRQVRRRRSVRRLRRAGSVLLVPLLLALLLWYVYPPPESKLSAHRVPYTLVRTEPMPRSALVRTQPFPASGLVTSAPSADIATITTSRGKRGYRQIDDAVLLALAGTNAAVLVRLGPHSAELVFASGTAAVEMPQFP